MARPLRIQCYRFFSYRKMSRSAVVTFLPDYRAGIVLCGHIATLASYGYDRVGSVWL